MTLASKMNPTGHRVLIQPDLKTETKSGIVLAYDARRASVDSDTGILVKVGPQAWKGFNDGTAWAQVGDKVYYSKYGAKVLKDGDNFVIICNDEDVLAIVNDESLNTEDVEAKEAA